MSQCSKQNKLPDFALIYITIDIVNFYNDDIILSSLFSIEIHVRCEQESTISVTKISSQEKSIFIITIGLLFKSG